MEKRKKPRKIKLYGPKWNRLAVDLALIYAPPVLKCSECGYPRLKGYICMFCGGE